MLKGQVMNGPITPESDWFAYMVSGLLALGGSVARAGRWTDPKTGKFSVSQFGVEIAAAGVIGSMAVGLGVYAGWPLPIVGAISGLGGLVGPAFLAGSFQAYLQRRLGSATDGRSNKPSGQ